MQRIKVCCISSIDEAECACVAGASALGLVAEMPSGPGIISDSLIAEIAAWAPPGVATFLLTSRQSAKAIIAHHQICRTSTIQLVDEVSVAELQSIRAALPSIKLVQVIHVQDPSSIEYALNVAPYVNALLLDSGNPGKPTKELGGTGRTHNWTLSREIVSRSPVPVYLAGGLSPENVADAIRTVRPFGVDLCSGVRTDRRLDSEKLRRFFSAVRQSDSTEGS